MTVLRLLPELDFGGVESRLQVQARLHDRRDYRLVVCGFHKPGKASRALADAGVQVDVLNVNPSPRNPLATLALARYLRQLKPDILHASIAEANWHGLLAGKLAGVNTLIAEETGMPNHSRTARLAYGAAYRLASTVVGVSKAVCTYITDVDHAPTSRVRLIYNCASSAYFPEPAPQLVARPSATLELLLVGRLVPVKNHLFFLDLLRQVLPEHPHVRVKFAGDGPLREQMRAAIADGALGTQVELLGARSDIAELLRRADVFALPSLSEGCSVSLIEAMASGVHAIGSDVAGIREVMGPLASDWTAPSSDAAAWMKLLRRTFALSTEMRARVAAEGRDRAYAQFSPSVYVRTLSEMYRELHR